MGIFQSVFLILLDNVQTQGHKRIQRIRWHKKAWPRIWTKATTPGEPTKQPNLFNQMTKTWNSLHSTHFPVVHNTPTFDTNIWTTTEIS